MSLEQQVADLTTATTSLLDAVNVRRAALDTAVGDAQSYAAEATANGQAQVALAADQVALAAQHAVAADASADAANLSAGEAAGSAAQALALFGDAQAVQTALINAQASASLAEGHALSAGSVVQQDLSAVSAALHRSPNAVTAMFVYDTSKDSDGGAWTEKCQHTSWWNEAINGKWLGAQASEAAARAVSGAATGDYFQLTTNGKFYRLNEGSGTTEVFRGNKRDFPRLAGIVAEASSVTIYDLTEPGRPMWMRFVAGGNATANYNMISGGSSTVTSVSAGNALLCAASSSAATEFGGLATVNFVSEAAKAYRTAAASGQRNYAGLISQRNAARGHDTTTNVAAAMPSAVINAVAMTVLPDAPVDPATGLKVPTIAVAAQGGVSVIRHNGSESKPSAFSSLNISFDARNAAVFGVGENNRNYRKSYPPYTEVTDFAGGPLALRGSVAALIHASMNRHTGKSFALARSFLANSVAVIRDNDKDNTLGAVAIVASTNNTGHLVGDIRRCYLSDNVVESVTGPELVTNGTFDTDISGWSFAVGVDATWSGDYGGSIKIVAPTTFHYAYRAVAVQEGKTYEFSFAKLNSSNYGNVRIGASIGVGQLYDSGTLLPAVVRRTVFTATTSTVYISLAANGGLGLGDTAYYDNISIKEVVADRSYKAQGASIAGTLTKSAVASAAELVAHSGFSAANYLREPYSADLDFGTGEWSVGAWVNVPVSLPAASFPNTGSELNTSPATWTTEANWVNNGGGSYTATATNAAIYRLGPAVGVAWRVTFTISGRTAGNVRISTRAFISQVFFTEGTHTVLVGGTGTADSNIYIVGEGFSGTVSGISLFAVAPVLVADRAHSSGAKLNFGVTALGYLTATAFDGTTTRTVTTTARYNTATWVKAEACYTTDGTLAIRVNGVEVAATRGNPLLTLNNSNAVLTIGNSYNLDAPFPGSIALLKLSATVPTAEQSVWMYEQEKQMFREGAKVCLPDSGSIVDLTYDDATDKWIAVSATNESEWSGLVRTSVTPAPAGSYTKAAAASGVQLLARSATNPGVDITIPAYGLREELVKRAEAAARLNAQLATFDYVGGFTANTTNGNTAIVSVDGLTYPTSYIGARVSGSGIPADTVVAGVSGTTIYLSAAATATATGVAISFVDYVLPVGYEAKAVSAAGALKQEGSTKDWTRLFDGFKETVRFGTAPAYNAWVQIQAARSAA